MPTPYPDMPAAVKAALDRGQKIEAIKLLREATGLGLKEAKDAVEHMEAGGSMPSVEQPVIGTDAGDEIARALAQGHKLEAIRLYREKKGVGLKEAKDAIEAMQAGRPAVAPGLSPGEVGRSGGLGWVAVAIAVVAIAAYLFFRSGS